LLLWDASPHPGLASAIKADAKSIVGTHHCVLPTSGEECDPDLSENRVEQLFAGTLGIFQRETVFQIRVPRVIRPTPQQDEVRRGFAEVHDEAAHLS
jgi:hypothetical protein